MLSLLEPRSLMNILRSGRWTNFDGLKILCAFSISLCTFRVFGAQGRVYVAFRVSVFLPHGLVLFRYITQGQNWYEYLCDT